MTAENAPAAPGADAEEEFVARYLRANAGFFARHPDLLAELVLPHDTGAAVSLHERQVELLRQRARLQGEHLDTLRENAKDNDLTFARIRDLTLALMDTGDESALDAAIGAHLVERFDVDHAACFVRGWLPTQQRDHLFGAEAGSGTGMFDLPAPTYASYPREAYGELFGETPSSTASVALVPLRRSDRSGGAVPAVLAIGALDETRFTPDMGSLFLVYVADILSRTLRRLGIG